MAKIKKSTENKQDFIDVLASMSPTDINDYIKRFGKPPKPVRLYRLLSNKDKKM